MTEPTPVVSIIVVTYNALDYVRVCLEGILARTRLSFELIVVDNASEPKTRNYLKSLDRIKLILNDENKLWVAACNQGICASDPRSKYLLLLNSDTEILRDDWLQILVAVIESDRKVGIVGPHHCKPPYGPVYGWVDGECLLVARRLIEEIGLFDEVRWPWAGAETEFAVAAFAKGWKYKIVHPSDRLYLHHRRKSHTPEAISLIKERYSGDDMRPGLQYLNILKKYGIQPRMSPLDRIIACVNHKRLIWRLGRILERRRFYYTQPMSKIQKESHPTQ